MDYDADESQRAGYDQTSPRPQADFLNQPMVSPTPTPMSPQLAKAVRFHRLRNKLLGK
jgi:hypothetical protein